MSNAALVGGSGDSAGPLPPGSEGFKGDPIPADGGAQSASPSVPEPSSLLLLALAVVVGMVAKRFCKADCRLSNEGHSIRSLSPLGANAPKGGQPSLIL
jgi:hypothetical protein